MGSGINPSGNTEAYIATLPVPGRADFDGDGDVDLMDFERLQTCFNGPNRPAAQSGCAKTDFDNDADVDLDDFQVFQSCFNGPNRPPACN